MPRVSPGAEEDDDNPIQHLHHHTPNRRHFKDVAQGHDKDVLVNFEQYTLKNSDEEDGEVSRRHRKSNESGGSRNRRSREQGRGDIDQPDPYYHQKETGTQRRSYTTSQKTTTTSKSKPKPFIQFDILAFVIIVAYLLCIAIVVLAVWCYRQDSQWNSIVRNERPFPTIANENFFGGKHLFVYDSEEGLRHAKKNMLRENRWLELMHLMFMSAFLILTLFQLAAYLTRGDEDHSRLIICYYTVFGGLGLIVALFPLLSWHSQENGYKVATHFLHDFSRRVWQADKSHWGAGITNATAQDTWTLGEIFKFCYDVSQDGVTIEEDTRYFSLFKRHYRLPHLQHLGFCTHHKFKIINTALSAIFALLLCAIPCIYCFQAGEQEKEEIAEAMKTKHAEMQQQLAAAAAAPPPRRYYDNEAEAGGGRRGKRGYPPPSHYNAPGGGELTERQLNAIEKFKRYIEADDEEA